MKERYALVILGCVTLGLAPFNPEPHIWGKLRWLLGGGSGMQLMDIFDLLMHGAPWMLLLGMLLYDGVRLARRRIS